MSDVSAETGRMNKRENKKLKRKLRRWRAGMRSSNKEVLLVYELACDHEHMSLLMELRVWFGVI